MNEHEPKKHGKRYPWERWFNQAEITLRKGTDFNGRVDTFAQQARNAAKPHRFNLKVSVMIADDCESIQIRILSRRGKEGPTYHEPTDPTSDTAS